MSSRVNERTNDEKRERNDLNTIQSQRYNYDWYSQIKHEMIFESRERNEAEGENGSHFQCH